MPTFWLAILTSKVGQTDLLLGALHDQGALVGLCMQDYIYYKSLCPAVMICALLVNIQTCTHRQHFDFLTVELIAAIYFSKMDGSEADSSIVTPSPSVRRRQSCYSPYSGVGMLPTVKLIQSGSRPVLGEHNSHMVGADSNRVRVAPPDAIQPIPNLW